MWFVIRHRRIVCLGANGPASNFLHGFPVNDGYCVIVGEVDEHSRTRTLELKSFNMVAIDGQLTGFLVCTEIDSDQEGMVERHVLTAGDHVESFCSCVKKRRVRQPFNVSLFGIILASKDSQETFVAVGDEDAIGFGKVEDGVRRPETSDALDAAICIQIENFNRLVVLACEKEPGSFFVHGKMIELAAKSRKGDGGFKLQWCGGLGRCTEARRHRNYKEEDEAQNPPASFHHPRDDRSSVDSKRVCRKFWRFLQE